MDDFADGFEFLESEAKTNESEKIDALEVISPCILFSSTSLEKNKFENSSC